MAVVMSRLAPLQFFPTLSLRWFAVVAIIISSIIQPAEQWAEQKEVRIF
jgi:hypothetical protein